MSLCLGCATCHASWRGSIVRDHLAATNRGQGHEHLRVDAIGDVGYVTVAQEEIDTARVKAAPAVLALSDVRGDAAASVVIGQQGGAVGVGARKAVEVEGIRPECGPP